MPTKKNLIYAFSSLIFLFLIFVFVMNGGWVTPTSSDSLVNNNAETITTKMALTDSETIVQSSTWPAPAKRLNQLLVDENSLDVDLEDLKRKTTKLTEDLKLIDEELAEIGWEMPNEDIVYLDEAHDVRERLNRVQSHLDNQAPE